GRLPRPRPDRQPAVVEADVVELVDVVDVDEVRRLGDAEVHERHKTLTARQDARLLPGRRQHGDRLARARGAVVGERGRLHGSLLTPGCADGPTLMTTYARRGNCVRRPLFARRRAPRPIGGRAHAAAPAGPYTPRAGAPLPDPPPLRMLPLRLRTILALLAAAALTAVAALALPATGAAATSVSKACRAAAPAKVSFTRDRGRAYGWLRWTKPKKARGSLRYRVTVNGKARRASSARRLKVRVRPGQRLRFNVSTTRAPRCGRALKATAKFYAPTTPGNVAAAKLSGTSARLSWAQAKNGDGKLAGYRVSRNGATYRQVKGTAADVAVPADVQSTLTVASVDTRGHVSKASAPVSVDMSNGLPGTPTGVQAITVSDTAIGVSWTPSTGGTGRIVGYRVYRGGTLLAQVAGPSYVASNLAPGQSYTFNVQAVDSPPHQVRPSAPGRAARAPP